MAAMVAFALREMVDEGGVCGGEVGQGEGIGEVVDLSMVTLEIMVVF